MGKKPSARQASPMWVNTEDLQTSSGHPFFERLNRILAESGFDAFVEGLCAAFYADRLGRPSLRPGRYFRLLLIGYFEGLSSERGIAWRVADSWSLRSFLDLDVMESVPDHSTLSRTRRRIDVETHVAVFTWVLERQAEAGLVKGKTVGVDATTLEANAAMRSIERRDTGESYEAFVRRLAEASGIETPTRAELARFDRSRKNKKTSNEQWQSPQDPDLANWTRGDRRARFEQTAERHAGLSQFAAPFLSRMKFVDEQGEGTSPTLAALRVYREHRAAGRRGVPPDAPLDFAPTALQPLIRHNGVTDRRRGKSALFLKVRDEIQTGNLAIDGAKNFGRFEAFFLPTAQWEQVREAFWARTGFPVDPAAAVERLKARLSDAFDQLHRWLDACSRTMVGMRFCPRIRSLHRQRIYCADPDRDHGVLEPVLKRDRRAVNFRLIAEQWDRIGQFYAAFPAGHATASAALQRLNRFQASNRFYAANRELGRALKTEFVLQYMSEPQLRAKVRRGLLKVEQLHALARAVYYGQRGRISAREVYDQMNACSCLTLILACIVYWQAREISRLATAPDFPVDPDLLRHVSPIEWKNVILYGEIKIDPAKLKMRRP